MASEKVVKASHAGARAVVEVWVAGLEALLQKWIERGIVDDRLGLAIASAQVAQLGLMITTSFKGMAEDLMEGETELRACQEAVRSLSNSLWARINEASGYAAPGAEAKVEPVAAHLVKGDSSMN